MRLSGAAPSGCEIIGAAYSGRERLRIVIRPAAAVIRAAGLE